MVRRLCQTIRAGFIPTVPPYFARRSFSEGGLHLCFFGLLTSSILRQAQDDIGYPMITGDAGFSHALRRARGKQESSFPSGIAFRTTWPQPSAETPAKEPDVDVVVVKLLQD